jgi:DNA-binding NtrC family response regulator
MQILMLDDQYRNWVSVFNHMAKHAGDQIAYAATPVEAETVMKQQKVDVLLLDGNLENGLKGLDVLAGWKSRDLPVPPVVMFSSDKEINEAGMRAGAIWSINKKNPEMDLLDIIREKLGAY